MLPMVPLNVYPQERGGRFESSGKVEDIGRVSGSEGEFVLGVGFERYGMSSLLPSPSLLVFHVRHILTFTPGLT